MATKSAREQWHGPITLDYSPADSFTERYDRFMQAGQSLGTFLRTVDDPDERTIAISSFAHFADGFLCELTARADYLKRKKTQAEQDGISSLMESAGDALLQFNHEGGDAERGLRALMDWVKILYRVVCASRYAQKRAGRFDDRTGRWIWNDAPKLSDSKVVILTLLCKVDSDGMTSREIIDRCNGNPEKSTIREGLRHLRKQGLIEKVGKQYRLTLEGRKTADRLIRSK